MCALAHQPGVGPRAQGQLQGIDQDGLASAGFARQGRETAAKLQLQRLHDDKVAQHHALERHGQEPPSFQRSFLRSVSK